MTTPNNEDTNSPPGGPATSPRAPWRREQLFIQGTEPPPAPPKPRPAEQLSLPLAGEQLTIPGA